MGLKQILIIAFKALLFFDKLNLKFMFIQYVIYILMIEKKQIIYPQIILRLIFLETKLFEQIFVLNKLVLTLI
jgi:hypothetical protein